MFCKKCGGQLTGNENFCSKCGAKVDTMRFVNPENGNTFDAAGIDLEKMERLNADCKKEKEYLKWINDEADLGSFGKTLKPILVKLVTTTVEVMKGVARVVIKIGKIVLNMIWKLLETYPTVVTGALVGFTIGMIISSIPLLGWLLGPIAVPLLGAIGAGAGFLADMSRAIGNASVERKIRARIMDDMSSMGFAWTVN
jgi:hypothetical protein